MGVVRFWLRWALIALLGVAVVFGGWAGWRFYRDTAIPAPPDVPGVARAPETEEARLAAERRMADRIDRLPELLPWAQGLGRSTVDVCRTDYHGGLFLRGLWLPVACERTVNVYLAFDGGDVRSRLADLDRYLDAEGWRSSQRWSGLVAADEYAHQPPADPTPEEVAEAAARPIAPSVEFRPATDEAVRTELAVSVSRPPGPELLTSGEDYWYEKYGGRRYRNDEGQRSEYLAWQPVRPSEVTGPAEGRYVVVLGFMTRYAEQQEAP
ncbi:hypothetical protein [Kitasatospora sp. MY 5-36]|uniref:hypothetical protein n=1 Tax=Kitasatospora sp. MY 5-36 TaxID=1678027 RepID=UPI00067102A9|nr:hypothetical protein [Kitasatospora sp. MY 5-36]